MGESFSLYGFEPNQAAPIVFCNLFGVSMAWHAYQNFQYKSWKITGSLPWGGLLFVAGFAMREASVKHTHDLAIFIATNVLLLCAPPVYSLTNYIVLGRTLYYVPYLSPIHPGRVISTFVGLDIIVAILTGNGAAKVSNIDNSATELRLGRGLLRTSILLQVICFLGFIALEVTFHRRCLRANIPNKKLRMIIILLYTSSALILIRNVYRVVEVFQGYTGYLQTHEAFFYVFDGTLMLINSMMLNLFHPMMFLPHSNKTYLCRNGVTETEGPGWVDKRPLLVTVFDPLDLVGLFIGRDKITKFWETEQAQGDDPRLHGEDSLAIGAPGGTSPPPHERQFGRNG